VRSSGARRPAPRHADGSRPLRSLGLGAGHRGPGGDRMTRRATPVLEEPLAVTREGPVATLWLNRPAKRNAVTLAMWQGSRRLLEELANDPSVRVLAVRGAGGRF